MSSHRVEASRFVAVDPARAFDLLLTAPREQVFDRRFGAFPPISEVRDQDGGWDVVGQARTLVLGDGGSLRETLTRLDRPHGFDYVLDDIHGKLRPFVTRVDGEWRVTPEDDGSRIGWAWTLHPAGTVARSRLTLTVISRMWQGYADRALRRVEDHLTS